MKLEILLNFWLVKNKGSEREKQCCNTVILDIIQTKLIHNYISLQNKNENFDKTFLIIGFKYP